MNTVSVILTHGADPTVIASDASPERSVRLARLACVQSGKGMADVRLCTQCRRNGSLLTVYYGAGAGETEQAAIDAIAAYDANPAAYDWT